MSANDKQPDKYKCLKIPIKSILHKTNKDESKDSYETLSILEDAITRTNKITTKTYMLLRLWILNKYHNQQDIPVITLNTILMCMSSLMLSSVDSNRIKGDNLMLLNDFKQLHNSSFSLENGKNLNNILNYYATTMITSIENNIKMHFFDYINRFIFSYYKFIHKEQLDGKNGKEFRKQLYKELNAVKKDIIENTLLSEPKYHAWINENRFKIVPEQFDTSYYYDIKVEPYKYLKNMIFMCLGLEKNECKSFQFFPIQSNAILRHIQIDTRSLIELFVDAKKHKDLIDACIKTPKTNKDGKEKNKTKSDLLLHIEDSKEFVWDKIFDINQSIKGYSFNHTIITDGYSCSLRFIHKDCIEEQQNKTKLKQNGKLALKGLTKEEKDKVKENKKEEQKEKAKQKRMENKDKPKQSKKEKKNDNQEFRYIDEVPKEDLQGNRIFIDPGKRSLLTMMDDDGKFFSYTNQQYLKSTKRIKYQHLLENYRDDIGITKIEKELNKCNSKSCRLDKFQEYVDAKLNANEVLVPLYKNVKFRKYKWYSFINRKRAQDNLINKIGKTYSKEHKIIIGDWSIGKQMRNFISTPNLTLKRKLKEHFQVYNIDEFRTSCLSYKTEERCENLYLKIKKDKKQKLRKMHSILTYKMENSRMGCINRDKNGCKNIQKLFNSYMERGEIPLRYRRDYKFQQVMLTNHRVN
jgi:hypothetical protein